MKRVALFCISFYQAFISPLFKQVLGVPAMCRYSPTCSEYTKQCIKKYGIIKGSVLGLQRLSTCHPFSKNSNSEIRNKAQNSK